MAKITRCPHCLSPVYEEAELCPHCEGTMSARRSRRIFTGASISFILVALVAWTATDSLLLLKKRKSIERDTRRRHEIVAIVQTALTHPDKLEDARPILAPLEEIHRRVDALPAEHLEDLELHSTGVYRIHTDQSGNTRSKRFSATRYAWSTLAFRGGRWWTLSGIICMKGDEPRCFRVDEVESHGQVRPGVHLSAEPR